MSIASRAPPSTLPGTFRCNEGLQIQDPEDNSGIVNRQIVQARVRSLERENEALKRKVQHLEQDKRSLQQNEQDYMASQRRVAQAQAQVQNLEQKCKSLQHEVAQAQAQVQNSEQKCKALQHEVAQAQAQAQNSEQQQQELQHRYPCLPAVGNVYTFLDEALHSALNKPEREFGDEAICIHLDGFLEGVFIGNSIGADPFSCNQKGIEYVLDLSRDQIPEFERRFWSRFNITHVCLRMRDQAWENILPNIDQAIAIIIDAVQVNRKRLLVHCEEGVNRSGAVVLAYHMRRRAPLYRLRKSHLAALHLFADSWLLLAQLRWPVLLQSSFRIQLMLWAQHQFDTQKTQRSMLFNHLRLMCFFLEAVRTARGEFQLGVGKRKLQRDAGRCISKLWNQRSPLLEVDVSDASCRGRIQSYVRLYIEDKFMSNRSSSSEGERNASDADHDFSIRSAPIEP